MLKILSPPVKMKSLQTLLLRNCLRLERVPEVKRENAMLVLSRYGCKMVRAVPWSTFSSFRALDFGENNLVDDDFASNMHHASYERPSLEELNLSGNTFILLPASISFLSGLKYLDLEFCFNLKELCELPSHIQGHRSNICRKLEKIGDLSNIYKWLYKISLSNCPKLLKNEESKSHLDNLLTKSFVQKCAVVNHRLSIVVPGTEIPKWFTRWSGGNKITLKLPQKKITRMKGLAICFCSTTGVAWRFRIKFKPLGEGKLNDRPPSADPEREIRVWIGYMSADILRNLCHGFESEYLIITFNYDGIILECGVCEIYEDDITPVTEIGTWIPDYDELQTIDRVNGSSEDLQQGRWSTPIFSFGNEKTRDQNTVKVDF